MGKKQQSSKQILTRINELKHKVFKGKLSFRYDASKEDKMEFARLAVDYTALEARSQLTVEEIYDLILLRQQAFELQKGLKHFSRAANSAHAIAGFYIKLVKFETDFVKKEPHFYQALFFINEAIRYDPSIEHHLNYADQITKAMLASFNSQTKNLDDPQQKIALQERFIEQFSSLCVNKKYVAQMLNTLCHHRISLFKEEIHYTVKIDELMKSFENIQEALTLSNDEEIVTASESLTSTIRSKALEVKGNLIDDLNIFVSSIMRKKITPDQLYHFEEIESCLQKLLVLLKIIEVNSVEHQAQIYNRLAVLYYETARNYSKYYETARNYARYFDKPRLIEIAYNFIQQRVELNANLHTCDHYLEVSEAYAKLLKIKKSSQTLDIYSKTIEALKKGVPCVDQRVPAFCELGYASSLMELAKSELLIDEKDRILQEAIKYTQNAQSRNEKINDSNLEKDTLHVLATAYYEAGKNLENKNEKKFNKLIESYYLLSIELAISNKEPRKEAKARIQLAHFYFYNSNYDKDHATTDNNLISNCFSEFKTAYAKLKPLFSSTDTSLSKLMEFSTKFNKADTEQDIQKKYGLYKELFREMINHGHSLTTVSKFLSETAKDTSKAWDSSAAVTAHYLSQSSGL